MTSHEIRIELAALGWNTEDKLSNFGWGTGDRRGYSVWVSRWNWHGVRLGSSVSFHQSVSPENLTPENIDAAWTRCRNIALAAWDDYPHSLPMVTADGKVIEDKTLTLIVCGVHGGNPWTQSTAN